MSKKHPDFPPTAAAFDKVRPAFTAWLLEHGSAILAPTNQYEVIRFIGSLNTCVVYRNEAGKITSWANGASDAWTAFAKRDDTWRATQTKRDRKTIGKVRSLAARDGWGCAYCPVELTLETATLEHVVPVTCGGTSHLANLTLACGPCNREVGHRSAREKIEFAIERRLGLSRASPAEIAERVAIDRELRGVK